MAKQKCSQSWGNDCSRHEDGEHVCIKGYDHMATAHQCVCGKTKTPW